MLIYGWVGCQPFLQFVGFPPILTSGNYTIVATAMLAFSVIYQISKLMIKLNITIIIFIILFVNMFFIGLVENELSHNRLLTAETVAYFRFLLFMIIGYNIPNYLLFQKALFKILIIGVVLNIIGLAVTSTDPSNILLAKPLTYDLQYLLIPALFLIFNYPNLNKNQKIFVIIGFVLYIIEQIMFVKRLPMLRILTILCFIYFAVFAFDDNFFKKSSKYYIRVALLLFSVLLVGFLVLNTDNFFSKFESKMTRYGSISQTIEDDARWKIGDLIIEDLTLNNNIYTGKGFGGVVFHESFFYDPAGGVGKYRSASEMGVPTILLKGGIPLLGYFIFLFVSLIFKYETCRTQVLGFELWVYVFIYFFFLYFEGTINSGSFAIQDIILAYSIGFLSSNKKLLKQKLQFYESLTT